MIPLKKLIPGHKVNFFIRVRKNKDLTIEEILIKK